MRRSGLAEELEPVAGLEVLHPGGVESEVVSASQLFPLALEVGWVAW